MFLAIVNDENAMRKYKEETLTLEKLVNEIFSTVITNLKKLNCK